MGDIMDRRGFLGRILAAGVAPAFVGSGILMPVKKLIVPEFEFRQAAISFVMSDVGLHEAGAVTPDQISAIIAETLRRRAPEIVRNVERNNSLLRAIKGRKLDINGGGYTIQI